MSVLTRPLVPGATGTPDLLTSELQRRWEGFVQSAPRGPDARCSLLIEEDGQLLGWARMDRLSAGWYALVDLALTARGELPGRAPAALAALTRAFADARLEAATWRHHGDPRLQALLAGELEGGRFELYVEKLYVRRSLKDFRSPYADPFALVSLVDAGERSFVEVLGQAMEGSPARDLHPERPREEFAEMRALEAETHDPERWCLALLDGEPAGVILANRFPYDDEGTFTFIGLCRAFRGRGLGPALHARGLELLREMGARRYLCSTDLMNTPMLRLYARHGCQPFDVRRQYLWVPR